MSFSEDEEILQDFLVEATEIVEQLGEQLVELETSPQDQDLLNAIFRGYHTVKGGAGFLNINPLVEICHRTEDVFNALRQGERVVDPQLMDVILNAHDVVTTMVDAVREGQEPEPADPQLLETLKAYAHPGEVPATVPQTEADTDAGSSPDAEAQGETESMPEGSPMVEAGQEVQEPRSGDTAEKSSGVGLQFSPETVSETSPEPLSQAAVNDEITDEEFEALLDQLHGGGAPKGLPTQSLSTTPKEEKPSGVEVRESGATRESRTTSRDTERKGDGDEITDEEFEALLDQLHGGGAPGMSPQAAAGDGRQGVSAERDVSQSTTGQSTTGQSTTGQSTAGAARGAPVAQPAQPASGAASGSDRPADGKPADKPENKAAAKLENRRTGQPQGAAAVKAVGKKDSIGSGETTVRVDTKRLDDIMNLVGELVLVRNRLVTLESSRADEDIAMAVDNLDLVTSDLQAAVMKTRMQPIKKVFGRFPRVVRDLARSLKKEVQLELQGEETDLDKNLVEALADPLVHLVRNAVDHGIEPPEVRERAGKPRTGTVVLSAEQEGDHILLSISDDGAGMDAEVLRRKAVEKGVLDEEAAARLSPQECYQLIFMPGFSTKNEISDVSGRGVGMDVVKTKITQLNGSLDIESEPGKGSKIIIKVPLTLAIMPTLMIKVDTQILALPLGSVAEIFHLDLSETKVVDGQEVVLIRNETLPLFYLKKWLVNGSYREEDRPREGHVVVVNVGSRQVGFVVDKLLGQEEVVIKPLGALLHGTKGIAGATITGDGRISLILDVPNLLHHFAHVM